MRIYEMGRQTGKTRKLVDWLRFNPHGVLIVHSAEERQRILRQYGYGLTYSKERKAEDDSRVITVQGVLDGRLRGRHPLIVAVDNLDLILPYLLGAEVGPVTMTPEWSSE